MTSQNRTLRCAASTMYSSAGEKGANTASAGKFGDTFCLDGMAALRIDAGRTRPQLLEIQAPGVVVALAYVRKMTTPLEMRFDDCGRNDAWRAEPAGPDAQSVAEGISSLLKPSEAQMVDGQRRSNACPAAL